MPDATIGLAAAFAAGVVSFLSPCVLPLVPVYVCFITGMTLSELGEESRDLRGVIVPMLSFVTGFSVTFVALGASASLLGTFVGRNRDVLERVAGVVVFAMGLILVGALRTSWPSGRGFDASRLHGFGRWAAPALGLAFPFALGPCSGPIYGAILTMAADSASVSRGALLLGVFSLGLAVPFIATGLLFRRMAGALRRAQHLAVVLNRVAGMVLITVGAAMTAGFMSDVSTWVGRVLAR